MDVLLLIVSAITGFFCCAMFSKVTKKRGEEKKIECLLNLHDNFYFKDFSSKTEIFNLRIGDTQFDSLTDFLLNFEEGDALLNALLSCNEEERKLNLTLHSKDDASMFFSGLMFYLNQANKYLFVYFVDLSQWKVLINRLTIENDQLKSKINHFQRTIDESPFIIHSEIDGLVVSNKLYKNHTEQLNFKARNVSKSVQIAEREFFLLNVFKDDQYYIFGSRTTHGTRGTEEYEYYINTLGNHSSDPLILIDREIETLAKNYQFKKIYSMNYRELLNENLTLKEAHISLIKGMAIENNILPIKINQKAFNAVYIPAYDLSDHIIYVILKKLQP